MPSGRFAGGEEDAKSASKEAGSADIYPKSRGEHGGEGTSRWKKKKKSKGKSGDAPARAVDAEAAMAEEATLDGSAGAVAGVAKQRFEGARGEGSGLEKHVTSTLFVGDDRLDQARERSVSPPPSPPLLRPIRTMPEGEKMTVPEFGRYSAYRAADTVRVSHRRGFEPATLKLGFAPGLGAVVACQADIKQRVTREVVCRRLVREPASKKRSKSTTAPWGATGVASCDAPATSEEDVDESQSVSTRLGPGALKFCYFFLGWFGEYWLSYRNETNRGLAVVIMPTADLPPEASVASCPSSVVPVSHPVANMESDRSNAQAAMGPRRRCVDEEDRNDVEGHSLQWNSQELGSPNSVVTSSGVDTAIRSPASETMAYMEPPADDEPALRNFKLGRSSGLVLDSGSCRESSGQGHEEDHDRGDFVQQRSHVKRTKRLKAKSERAEIAKAVAAAAAAATAAVTAGVTADAATVGASADDPTEWNEDEMRAALAASAAEKDASATVVSQTDNPRSAASQATTAARFVEDRPVSAGSCVGATVRCGAAVRVAADDPSEWDEDEMRAALAASAADIDASATALPVAGLNSSTGSQPTTARRWVEDCPISKGSCGRAKALRGAADGAATDNAADWDEDDIRAALAASAAEMQTSTAAVPLVASPSSDNVLTTTAASSGDEASILTGSPARGSAPCGQNPSVAESQATATADNAGYSTAKVVDQLLNATERGGAAAALPSAGVAEISEASKPAVVPSSKPSFPRRLSDDAESVLMAAPALGWRKAENRSSSAGVCPGSRRTSSVVTKTAVQIDARGKTKASKHERRDQRFSAKGAPPRSYASGKYVPVADSEIKTGWGIPMRGASWKDGGAQPEAPGGVSAARCGASRPTHGISRRSRTPRPGTPPAAVAPRRWNTAPAAALSQPHLPPQSLQARGLNPPLVATCSTWVGAPSGATSPGLMEYYSTSSGGEGGERLGNQGGGSYQSSGGSAPKTTAAPLVGFSESAMPGAIRIAERGDPNDETHISGKAACDDYPVKDLGVNTTVPLESAGAAVATLQTPPDFHSLPRHHSVTVPTIEASREAGKSYDTLGDRSRPDSTWRSSTPDDPRAGGVSSAFSSDHADTTPPDRSLVPPNGKQRNKKKYRADLNSTITETGVTPSAASPAAAAAVEAAENRPCETDPSLRPEPPSWTSHVQPAVLASCSPDTQGQGESKAASIFPPASSISFGDFAPPANPSVTSGAAGTLLASSYHRSPYGSMTEQGCGSLDIDPTASLPVPYGWKQEQGDECGVPEVEGSSARGDHQFGRTPPEVQGVARSEAEGGWCTYSSATVSSVPAPLPPLPPPPPQPPLGVAHEQLLRSSSYLRPSAKGARRGLKPEAAGDGVNSAAVQGSPAAVSPALAFAPAASDPGGGSSPGFGNCSTTISLAERTRRSQELRGIGMPLWYKPGVRVKERSAAFPKESRQRRGGYWMPDDPDDGLPPPSDYEKEEAASMMKVYKDMMTRLHTTGYDTVLPTGHRPKIYDLTG